MKTHYKKMVAPIVIALLCIAYLLFYGFAIMIDTGISLIIKALFGLMPLGFIGVCIYVLIERIEEIRSGEEDDLSKY